MLSTDRLVLRPLSTDHVQAVRTGSRRAHWAPDYPDHGDRDIAAMLAAEFRPGQYQIIERSTGLAVGGIGLFWPAIDGAVEFGYGVVPSRRGLGYATEAARRIIAAAFADPSVRCVYADVDADNPASIRVLQKSGLRRVTAGRYATDRPLDASVLRQHQRGSARPVGSGEAGRRSYRRLGYEIMAELCAATLTGGQE